MDTKSARLASIHAYTHAVKVEVKSTQVRWYTGKSMIAIATFPTKGRITIPKQIRSRVGIMPGDKAVFKSFDQSTHEIILIISKQKRSKAASR